MLAQFIDKIFDFVKNRPINGEKNGEFQFVFFIDEREQLIAGFFVQAPDVQTGQDFNTGFFQNLRPATQGLHIGNPFGRPRQPLAYEP